MCRYPALKHNEAFLRLEEDVWHVIVGMARRGVTFMDEALPYVVNMWQAKGLLSDGYCNTITTELNDWAAGWKRTKEGPLVARQVFLAALELAKQGGPKVGENENVVSAQDEKWLERLLEDVASKSREQSQTPAPPTGSATESAAETALEGEDAQGSEGRKGRGGRDGEESDNGEEEQDGGQASADMEEDQQETTQGKQDRLHLRPKSDKKHPLEMSSQRKSDRKRTRKKYDNDTMEVKDEKPSPVFDLDELKVMWEGREEVREQAL